MAETMMMDSTHLLTWEIQEWGRPSRCYRYSQVPTDKRRASENCLRHETQPGLPMSAINKQVVSKLDVQIHYYLQSYYSYLR